MTRNFAGCYKTITNFHARRACYASRNFNKWQYLKGNSVNKVDIIDHVARSADISKAAAGRAIEATVAAIKTTLKKGGMVTLVGFGTFYVGKRAARSGRNPQTGATIKIKAAKVPKFRAGKALKDAVN